MGLWESKGRRRMREFAIETSSSATSMMVGTLVEDRKEGGEGGGEEDLGRREEETGKKKRKEIGERIRRPESTNAANTAGVERETKKWCDRQRRKKEYFYDNIHFGIATDQGSLVNGMR